MKVPFCDLRRAEEPLRPELVAAFGAVLQEGRYILGPSVAELERQIAMLCGTKHAVGVSSGTDALLAAMMALGRLRRRWGYQTVITTPFTFAATASAIARAGFVPAFVDIEPDTYNLDPERVDERLAEGGVAGIVPVHLYGQCADMAALGKLADQHGAWLLEDAAQALGAADANGRAAGRLGHAGCFSFFPTKVLGALGDAGMVTTDDQEIADQVRMLRVQGASHKHHHVAVGGNFRLDELQAALLSVKLPRLQTWILQRRHLALRYRELLAAVGLGHLPLPDPPDALHVYAQFVVKVPSRDAVRTKLAAAGIGTEVYYPTPLHLQPAFRDLRDAPPCIPLPNAERAAREALALPIYPGLRIDEQHHVVGALQEALE